MKIRWSPGAVKARSTKTVPEKIRLANRKRNKAARQARALHRRHR